MLDASFVFDTQAWFTLGFFAWLELAFLLVFAAGFALMGLVLTVACGWGAVTPGGSLRERLLSAGIGLGVGALVFVGGRAVVVGTCATLFAWEHDFVAVRAEGARLVLRGGRGDGQARALGDLAAISLACTATEDSDHDWTCVRVTELRWADGTVSRTSDVLDWGLSPCRGALDALVEQARQLVTAAGRPDALVLDGNCAR